MTTSSSLNASARQRAACLYSLLLRIRTCSLLADWLELEACDIVGIDSIVMEALVFSMIAEARRGFLTKVLIIGLVFEKALVYIIHSPVHR